MYRNSVCLDLGTHRNDLKVTKLFPLYSEIKNKTRTITIFQWFSYLCSSGISRISDATEYPSPREKPEPLISIDTRADLALLNLMQRYVLLNRISVPLAV